MGFTNLFQIENEEKVADKINDEKKLKQLKNSINHKDLKKEVCKLIGISEEEIKQKNRIQRFVDVRKVLVILSKKYCDIPNRELAKDLNLSELSISKIIREAQTRTPKVKEIINEFENNK